MYQIRCVAEPGPRSQGESMPEPAADRMDRNVCRASAYNERSMPTADYASLSVSGPDAFDFLQAQLAADLRTLETDDGPLLSAWCNPKGRVICIMRVARTEGGYTLALPADLVDEVGRRLAMFRFRARIRFEQGPATAEQLGIAGPPDEWRLDNLRAGIAEISGPQSEAFTPHMLNLDRLGAVSISKGCYPGQEIVSRTHYRGASKRRLRRFESRAPAAAGDKISDGTRDVGEVVNAIGNELLAVVPVAADAGSLRVNGATLTEQPLPYSLS
jgi:tRNA-modifying protein YgfZ